jgi:hypothetical protein
MLLADTTAEAEVETAEVAAAEVVALPGMGPAAAVAAAVAGDDSGSGGVVARAALPTAVGTAGLAFVAAREVGMAVTAGVPVARRPWMWQLA